MGVSLMEGKGGSDDTGGEGDCGRHIYQLLLMN